MRDPGRRDTTALRRPDEGARLALGSTAARAPGNRFRKDHDDLPCRNPCPAFGDTLPYVRAVAQAFRPEESLFDRAFREGLKSDRISESVLPRRRSFSFGAGDVQAGAEAFAASVRSGPQRR